MAIGSHNFKDLMFFLKTCYELEVEAEVFSMVCMKDFILNSFQIAEIKQTISNNRELIEKYSNHINIAISILEISHIDFCPAFRSREIEIQPDGNVMYCCGMDYPEFLLGNIKKDTFRELLINKSVKTKQILNGVMNLMVNPDNSGINVKDRCSLCRWALGVEGAREEIQIIYNGNNK